MSRPLADHRHQKYEAIIPNEIGNWAIHELQRRADGVTTPYGHADETYVKVNGSWCYLYRAIDRDGNLVEALLGGTRDMAAAQRFVAQALDIVGDTPVQATTDGHDAYPRAIRETLQCYAKCLTPSRSLSPQRGLCGRSP